MKFERAEFEDWNPSAPTKGERIVLAGTGPLSASAKLSAASLIVGRQYPSPPSGVVYTPDVETMGVRYLGYSRGREPLAGMAYFCLNYMETWATIGIERQDMQQKASRARRAVADYLKISVAVLNKVGKLTAQKGGRLEGRKGKAVDKEYTDEERRFLEKAVKLMIRRAAEKAIDPGKELQEITRADLPPC